MQPFVLGNNSYKVWIVSDSKSIPGVAHSGNDWSEKRRFVQNAGVGSASNPSALLLELKTATTKIVLRNVE